MKTGFGLNEYLGEKVSLKMLFILSWGRSFKDEEDKNFFLKMSQSLPIWELQADPLKLCYRNEFCHKCKLHIILNLIQSPVSFLDTEKKSYRNDPKFSDR